MRNVGKVTSSLVFLILPLFKGELEGVMRKTEKGVRRGN